jgi:hypothetical protein
MYKKVSMKKFLIIGMIILGIVVLGMVNVNLNSKSLNVSEMFLANAEALSEESTENGGGSGGFDCMVKKDPCIFKATLSAQITILRRMGYTDMAIEVGVNLSNGTQIYYKKSFYLPTDHKVRCGKDVTCNDYQRQLGLIS